MDGMSTFTGGRRFLLLIWFGGWSSDGPDKGRRCLFPAEADALAWARREYPDLTDEDFLVIEQPEFERSDAMTIVSDRPVVVGDEIVVAGYHVPYKIAHVNQVMMHAVAEHHPFFGRHELELFMDTRGFMEMPDGWNLIERVRPARDSCDDVTTDTNFAAELRHMLADRTGEDPEILAQMSDEEVAQKVAEAWMRARSKVPPIHARVRTAVG